MKPTKNVDVAVERALKILQEHGYVVKKQIPYTKKTFEVSVPTLERLRDVQEALGYKLKEAVEEAFTQWLDKKSQEYERVSKAKSGK